MADIYQEQRAIDDARVSEAKAQIKTYVGNTMEYTLPVLTLQLGAVVLVALFAAVALRWRRQAIPDWVRLLFGVKRTLRSRRDLRPKAPSVQGHGLR